MIWVFAFTTLSDIFFTAFAPLTDQQFLAEQYEPQGYEVLTLNVKTRTPSFSNCILDGETLYFDAERNPSRQSDARYAACKNHFDFYDMALKEPHPHA